jgi:hypothetical protein
MVFISILQYYTSGCKSSKYTLLFGKLKRKRGHLQHWDVDGRMIITFLLLQWGISPYRALASSYEVPYYYTLPRRGERA